MAYREELEAILHVSLRENLWGHKITIVGDVVVVEGHKGLVVYRPELVQVRTGKKILQLTGERFELLHNGDAELVVRGKLDAVQVIG